MHRNEKGVVMAKKKAKTKKSLLKRVKITANKKLLRAKAGRRHLLSGKSKKRKRKLRKQAVVSSAQKELIKGSLPYNI